MIRAYEKRDGCLVPVNGQPDFTDTPWIDLIEPSREEEHSVEAALGIEVPTRDEMSEIESSSQFYREGDAVIMTLRIVKRDASSLPRLIDATFILSHASLVTVRYAETKPFALFAAHVEKEKGDFTPSSIFLGILEAIVDRAADILEEIGGDLQKISELVFNQAGVEGVGIVGADLQGAIQKIGRCGDIALKVRESLHGLNRAVSYFRNTRHMEIDHGPATQLSTLGEDIQSLLEHNLSLASNGQFLLDSTLGLINIQQNAIIKIFSVAAVMFLPATLIASIYGMNFHHMPELDTRFGYPLALGAMILSAVLPYLYFKRRRWL